MENNAHCPYLPRTSADLENDGSDPKNLPPFHVWAWACSTIVGKGGSIFRMMVAVLDKYPVPASSFGGILELLLSSLLFHCLQKFAIFAYCPGVVGTFVISRDLWCEKSLRKEAVSGVALSAKMGVADCGWCISEST